MAVYINTDKTVLSMRSDSFRQQPPVIKRNFPDYFSRTKVNDSSYIAQETFKTKIAEIVRKSVEAVGSFDNYFIVNPTMDKNANWYQYQEKQAIRGYYDEIKRKILEGVLREEWRQLNEMHASDEMYAQSNAYFKSAIKEVGVTLATAGAGKAFGKILTKYSGRTVNKLIKPGTKLNETVGKALGKEFKIGKGIFSLKFQSIDYGLEKSIEGFAESGDRLLTSDRKKQYEGFDPDYFGDNWLGNSIDFVASLHPMAAVKKKIFGDDIIRKGADFATDLIPVVSWAKTGVASLGGIVLGFQTRAAAKRMKVNDEKNNHLEHEFNRKLTQTIHDDISFWDTEDIKNMIKILKINKSTK